MDSSTPGRSELRATRTIAAFARLLGSVVTIASGLSDQRKCWTTLEGRCWLYEAEVVRSHSSASMKRHMMTGATSLTLCQCMLDAVLTNRVHCLPVNQRAIRY